MSARGGLRRAMGNALNLIYPTGTREVRVYFEKGRLLQFSGPVPALKLLQENPNHLLVYSVVKEAAELESAKETVSRGHVRIRLVRPDDMLQVSRVYFLVHVPEQNHARFAQYFSPESPSMSSPSTRSPSMSAPAQLVDSPATSTPFINSPSASALSMDSPYESPRPLHASSTIIGSARHKMMHATKHGLPNSGNPNRIQSPGKSGRLPSSLTNAPQRSSRSITYEEHLKLSPSRQTSPRPIVASQDRPRKSTQHPNGRSPLNNSVRNPRRTTSRSGSRRPVNTRSRMNGVRSPPQLKPHQPRPLVRTVSDSVSLDEDMICISCCPRFKEERGRRPKRRHPSLIIASPDVGGSSDGGGSGPAPQRSMRSTSHGSASWQPGLESISENSISISIEAEKLIPNPFFFPKSRPLVHRRRIAR